jgi:Iron-sulfur cluster-binding domain
MVTLQGVAIPDRSAGCDSSEVLTISYTGKVALCCNDYFVSNGHGDLNELSVQELWRRSALLRLRLFVGDYKQEICRVCTGQQAAAQPLTVLRTASSRHP